MFFKRLSLPCLILLFILQPIKADETEEVMKSIKGGDIFEINKHLSSPEMEGRL